MNVGQGRTSMGPTGLSPSMVHRWAGHHWSTRRAQSYHLLSGYSAAYKPDIKHVVPQMTIVRTKGEAHDVLEDIDDPLRLIAVDTEYEQDDPEQQIVFWSLSDGANRVGIMPKALPVFKRWLENPKCRKVMHHQINDTLVFRKNGIDVRGQYADTMVMDWLVDENRNTNQHGHSLKSCAKDWLGINIPDFKQTFGYVPANKKKLVVPSLADVMANDFDRMAEYATMDAYCTWWLCYHHTSILQKLKMPTGTLWDYYLEHEQPFTRTLTEMRTRGFPVSTQWLKYIGVRLEQTIRITRHGFIANAPAVRVKRKVNKRPVTVTLQPDELNPKSSQQMAALFYDELKCKTHVRTRAGNLDLRDRSVDEEHRQHWIEQGVYLAKLLDAHVKAAKMHGTFVRGFLQHARGVRDATGSYYAIFTTLKQHTVVTGRLASADPNLQNVPARAHKDAYKIRKAFRARRGCKLIVADYSGAELRMMAHFSQDKQMLRAFRKGLDLHSLTAKRVFNLPGTLEEIKHAYPDERNKAKAINFGLQYGMKAGLLAHQLDVPRSKAQDYLNSYFDVYRGVDRWMRQTIVDCKKQGYVTTLLGRRRRVPEIYTDPDQNFGVYSHAENMAMNAPIQGSVADVLRVAMNLIETDPFLKEREARLLLQVHDEVIVETTELDAPTVRDRVVELMESVAKLTGMTVDMPVEAAIGDSWGDAKG